MRGIANSSRILQSNMTLRARVSLVDRRINIVRKEKILMEKEENEEEKKDYHGEDGKFKEGNPGGPGGKRVGAGRPPKPDETLLKRLYSILETSSELAVEVLEKQLKNSDAKIAQGAAKVILGKILPERSAFESWKINEIVSPETHKSIGDLLALKRQKDLGEDKEEGLKLVKSGGN
jgi:hypothetical protein